MPGAYRGSGGWGAMRNSYLFVETVSTVQLLDRSSSILPHIPMADRTHVVCFTLEERDPSYISLMLVACQ